MTKALFQGQRRSKARIEQQRVFPPVSNPAHLIVERDDGRFQIGLREEGPGPFETRQFAEAVAVREVRHARTPLNAKTPPGARRGRSQSNFKVSGKTNTNQPDPRGRADG